MSLLVLDLETVDPYLSLGLGPGWVYEHHLKQNKFKVIGWSSCHVYPDKIGESEYTSNLNNRETLFAEVDNCDGLVMHNAPYDLGCLIVLGYPIEKLKIKVIYDTKIMAKLYNNQLPSFSLDDLSKLYLPVPLQKKKGTLADIVKKHGLLKTKKGVARDTETKTYPRDAEKYAYTHMDELQALEPDLMAYYANQDTGATAHLAVFFAQKLSLKLNNGITNIAAFYSYMTFICNVALRIKGVRVSIPAIHKAINVLEPLVKLHAEKIIKLLNLPADTNLESAVLAKAVVKAGYPLPKTAGGKPSLTSTWIEAYEGSDELLKTIKEYRATNKLLRDFAHTILTNLEHTCPDALHGQDYGYVYPELNVLAAKTGRMSASNPNIQQIPNADKSEYAKLIRCIYVPDENKLWVSCDWANQEGRWQVHYGRKYGAEKLLEAFIANPHLDMHYEIAKLMRLTCDKLCDPKTLCAVCKKGRKQCKGINLGLSYGMGVPKLAEALKISEEDALILRDQYNTVLPYLKQLGDAVSHKLKHEGHIKFFDGRVFRRETAIYKGRKISFDYKGINALMQGNGASQMYSALYKAYMAGLDILFPVHDEINIQVPIDDDADIERLKYYMESTDDIKCMVPMPIEIKQGPSWGEVK